MRNWNVNLLTEIASESYIPFHLLSLEFSPPLRYTTCDVPLAFQGNLYTPRSFEVGELQYSIDSGVDSVTVSIDVADRDPSLLVEFVGGTPGDTTAHLYLQVLDANYKEIATAVLFSGKIDSYEHSTDVLTTTIASFHSLWNKMTMERSTPHCRRNFRQVDCGYAGAETACDRSYIRCGQLANTTRFNGFRFLPSLEDKDLWWGREFKEEIPT